MKSVKELRRKAARRTAKTAPVYSTSEARANFAEALESAQVESAVIGFDRYGRTVAALVPIEAIYMLAGMGEDIDPAVRNRIARGVRQFVALVPNRVGKRIARKAPAAKKKTPTATSRAKAKARRR
jgi:endonuclease YncB( thermonuclease family)